MAMTRREFIRKTSATAATIGLPLVVPRRAFGANDDIRIAVIGCGVRGGVHIAEFGRQKGVRITAVCDPDRLRSASAAKSIEARFGKKPDEFADVRRLIDGKDCDVVSVATMQYWHSLPTIWACQTGRHVYVEKPLAHYIWEGRQMVNAARKYDRLVQVGLQSRSSEAVQQAIEYVKSGQLGKIQYVVCFANKARTSIGKRSAPLPIPETLDYDLWCGPARKEPVYRDRIQYDCSFTWNMGDGESCNQGVHQVDIARWLLGETGLPRRVMSVGGRFVFNDAGEVPNTQIIYYDYEKVPILYQMHNLRAGKNTNAMPSYRGYGVGLCVQCDGGYAAMAHGRGDSSIWDNHNKKVKHFTGAEDHFANFIEALRSGKRADLHAEILEGHLSTNICHAGNISHRLGKKSPAAEIRKQIGDLPVFQEMFDGYLKHLKAHKVDSDESILGPWLECDRDRECFKNNVEANKLVRGSYREPFIVPEVTTEMGQVAQVLAPLGAQAGGASTSPVRVSHLSDKRQFAEIKAVLENDNPGLRLTLVAVDGESVLHSEHGGMRVFWIYRGNGEVFVPKGYRTQEGDGGPLPAEYKPANLAPAFADVIRLFEDRLASLTPAATVPVRRIVGRLRGGAFVGNYAGDLWTLEHLSRPWSNDKQVEAALDSLFHMYREQGFSTKQVDSYEPIMGGDQLIACAQQEIRVRGRFKCLAMENVGRSTSHESMVRRLRYLLDTAGGCNPDFDPFRRLPLTWFPNHPGESGDGLNWVNSHVVNIPKETSPTHFHPPKAVGGTTAQREMYLVLDPEIYKLNTWGRTASLIVYPDLRNLHRYEEYHLEPEMFIYIPPGTGHRGLDAFVNVLTIPGFRPHNEYYLDRDIRDQAEGKSPYNEKLLDSKNYRTIEELL